MDNRFGCLANVGLVEMLINIGGEIKMTLMRNMNACANMDG
jgi:hypothetical protein